ncbi:8363_t:CDS:2 [Paraglomus brasilianum]|uniref:8363_t:CDS:1 n=1 Tax=Paraglomus brasilianum TaxID=144538 RepID=A0A9N9GAF4_9GLOM|nr:8363_t:CDS:2 [Paraglomus brasilianum]
MELSNGVVLQVFDEVIPKLKLKNDGLIFASSVAGYILGTLRNPTHENSRPIIRSSMLKNKMSIRLSETTVYLKEVEVVYDPTTDSRAPWKFLRFRDDKDLACEKFYFELNLISIPIVTTPVGVTHRKIFLLSPQQPTPPTPKDREDGHLEQHVTRLSYASVATYTAVASS